LSNYYDILGVSQVAEINEIKSAFRRLAKLYHPDKNPGEKELFAGILRAYETLVDPALRSAYDRKLRYQNQSYKSTERTRTKNWTFEERELRRRKYYEEHIKQYEKSGTKPQSAQAAKNNYNEYKYILFATPLAVALLLLIIRLAAPQNDKLSSEIEFTSTFPLDLSVEAVSLAFGNENLSAKDTVKIELLNALNKGVLLSFFSNNKHLKSCYLKEGSKINLNRFPPGPYELRMILAPQHKYATFYFSKSSLNLTKALLINEGLLNQMNEVDEKEFFTINK